MQKVIFSIFLILFFFNGCSQKVAIVPKSDLLNAKIALMEAKDNNASSLAPKEFNRAKEYFEKTKIHMQKKEYKKVQYLAQKSYINAKVANEKAKNMKLKKQMRELKGDINLVNKDFAEIKE